MSEPVSNNLKYLEDNYRPSEIQKLLSSGKLKKEVFQKLKVSSHVLDNYIKRHNLIYISKRIKRSIRDKKVVKCEYCDSDNTIKNGKSEGVQRIFCKDCNRTFGIDIVDIPKKVSTSNITYEETEDPVKKFYEMLNKKKEKRALRELKNPYDW